MKTNTKHCSKNEDIADADLYPVLDEDGFLPNAAVEAKPDLINYYQNRIGQHEDELREIDKIVQVAHVAGRDVHRVKWSSSAKQEEIKDLQDALADANAKLSREREALLELLEENDTLRKKEMLDRVRIQDLLAITQPVAQEVTFFRDCRPSKMTRYPTASMLTFQKQSKVNDRQTGLPSSELENRERGVPRIVTNDDTRVLTQKSVHIPGPEKILTATGATSNDSGISEATGISKTSPPSAVKTIYLPSEKPETLMFLVEALQRQLKDHEVLSKELLSSIEQDVRERELSGTGTVESLLNIVTDLQERIPITKHVTKELTSELLLLKHGIREKEKSALEKTSVLRHEFEKVRESLLHVRRQNRLEVQASQAVITKVRDLNLLQARQRYEQAKQDLKLLQRRLDDAEVRQSIGRLRKHISATRNEYSKLEETRQYRFSKYAGALEALRNRIRKVEAKLVQEVAPNVMTGMSTPRRQLAKSQLNILRDQLSVLEHSIPN